MARKPLRNVHRKTQLHWVGNGFPVRSVFDYRGLGRELSPFLLLDYAAPYKFPPGQERRGVGAHPHKGFETVTIAYQGELEHRDSSGGGGVIGPGDVQWMTAGRGIVHEEFHSERFTRAGGTLHMVQLWVNLRAADKSAPAGYQTLLNSQIPSVALPDAAGSVRIIAGEFAGRRGPARTFSPINLWDVQLNAGAHAALPLPDGHTSAVLVIAGDAAGDGQPALGEGDLAVFEPTGDGIEFWSTQGARLLILDGEPLNEPIVGQGPFVMNTRQEIEQAFAEFEAGQMGEIEHA